MHIGFLYLGLCILATDAILIGLKEVQRRNLDLLQAVTVNYVIATLVGVAFSPGFFNNVAGDHPEVLPLALILGLSFILIFFIMGMVIREIGVAYTTILSKMSVIIPVMFSFIWYQETLGAKRVAGIAVALLAVVLINLKQKNKTPTGTTAPKSGMMPGLLALLALSIFLGTGANDIMFKIFNKEHSQAVSDEDFTIFVLGTAAILGALVLGYNMLRGKSRLDPKSMLAGVAIGIPNFFSVIFLTRSLEYFDGTVFYPVNNIGQLATVSLVGIILYKEVFNRMNYLGLLAALLAILLLV